MVLLLACCVILLVQVGVAAARAPSEVSRDEVFAALGVDQTPGDYVILVDTSGSMQSSGLYPQVVSALAPLMKAMSPADHLSLLTFDTAPTLRYSGPVGADPSAAISQLPPEAAGENTDIGAAAGAGLSELERPDASAVGTVVLLTDGRHQPSPGSAYPTAAGPAWDLLRQRGDSLTADRAIRSYALALNGSADATLLKSVFADSVVVALPGDQLAGYLDRVKEETRIDKAKQILSSELPAVVKVTWDTTALRRLDLGAGSGEATVELTSTSAHVPIHLSDLRVQGDGFRVSGLPPELDLEPGQTKPYTAQLSFAASGGFGFGQREETRQGQLTMEAQVGSPWQDVLGQDLDLPFQGGLEGGTTPVSAQGLVGWSWLTLVLIAALLVLVALVLVSVWINRRPKLRGALIATPAGQLQAQVVLSGRRVPIGKVRGSRLHIPGAGQVMGVRSKRRGRRGHDIDLAISYSTSGDKRRTAQVKANATTSIDGTSFTYRG
jgi:hypothetical protein